MLGLGCTWVKLVLKALERLNISSKKMLHLVKKCHFPPFSSNTEKSGVNKQKPDKIYLIIPTICNELLQKSECQCPVDTISR